MMDDGPFLFGVLCHLLGLGQGGVLAVLPHLKNEILNFTGITNRRSLQMTQAQGSAPDPLDP